MRLAVTDDRPEDRAELCALLDRYLRERQLKAEYEIFPCAEDLLRNFAPGRFQIAFLDIYMPGMDGMAAARRLHDADPACRLIFFTTSHTHAVESYAVRAAYYLTKPLDYPHLREAMDVVCADLLRDNCFLTVGVDHIRTELLLRDVFFMDCGAERTRLHLEGRVLMVDDRASDVLERLTADERFLCCNRNTAVNMDQIAQVLEADFLLKDGGAVPIRQRGRKAVKRSFLEYSLRGLRKGEQL